MNFDDLKDSWANDATGGAKSGVNTGSPAAADPGDPAADIISGARTPVSGIPLNKVSSAVSRLRRNIKREFIGQLVGYLAPVTLFLIFSKSPASILIVSVATFILVMQGVYYFYRFYLFYKSAGRYDWSVRKNIGTIIYTLELNMEIYKTWSLCAMPLATLVGITMIGGGLFGWFAQLMTSGYFIRPWPLIWIFIILVICQVAITFFVNLHLRLQYGRYLAELKGIRDELETEE